MLSEDGVLEGRKGSADLGGNMIRSKASDQACGRTCR